ERSPGPARGRRRRAAGACPDEPLLQVMLGELLASQRKLDEAAPAFRRALELRPRLEVARVNLARLQLARNDAAAAEALVKEGLALAPPRTMPGTLPPGRPP